MSRSKYFVVFVVIVLVAFVLNGCLMSQSPTSTTEPKTVLKGRVMVPEGTVKGKQINGQALVGATVNIIDPKTGNVIATTTTDANGNYNVEVPAGGPYIVEAVKGNVKVLDVSPVIQAGETKDLGTADAFSTAQALIFQALVEKGNDPAQINLEGILSLSGFSQLANQVESALEAGTDPTTNSQVNNLVNNIISPKPPIGGETQSTMVRQSTYAFQYKVPSEIKAKEIVNVDVTFTSVVVRELGYKSVCFKFGANGPGNVTFKATDTGGVGHTFNNNGFWGPAEGFDLPANYTETTNWTLEFSKHGEYTIFFSLVDAGTGQVINNITNTIKVTVSPPKPIYNDTKGLYYDNIQDAINDADEGDIVLMTAGTYQVNETIIVNKAITIKGDDNLTSIINTSGGKSVFQLAAAANVDGIFIRKTDKLNQHLITITANNASVKNSKFVGQYVQGDNEVARAIVPNAGITGYTLCGNHFENLRQPGYLEGAGTVTNNFVKNTRGWVVCVNHNVTFINNSFEDNAVDIAIITNQQTQSDFYKDIAAISRQNNGAHVENQLLKASAKNGNLVVEADGNDYIKSIKNAINAAVYNDTIYIYPGEYDGFLVNKDSIIIKGTEESIIKPVGIPGYDATSTGIMVDARNVVIEGFKIDGNNITPPCRGISGFNNAEFIVKNTMLNKLTTGIYAKTSVTSGIVELTATGNEFINCVAGIGGTEDTFLKEIESNVFNTCTEGIGLGKGVHGPGSVGDLIEYLENNNTFVNCTDNIKDYR